MTNQSQHHNVSPRVQKERVLYFVGEVHTDRREEHALELSRGYAAQLPPHLVVRTFLEGVRNEESSKLSSDKGLNITGVNSAAVAEVYWPLAIAVKFVRFCNIASAHGSPRYPNSELILKEAEQEADAFFALTKKERPQEPILAIQECMLMEMAYALHSGQSYISRRIDPAELMTALEEMPDTVSGNIPALLSGLIQTVVESVSAEKIARFNELSSEATDYFALSKKKFVPDSLRDILEAVKSLKVYPTYAAVDSIWSIVRDNREKIMAYFIARSEFDVGVFNCGWNHALSKRMNELFSQQGISVQFT